MLNRKKHDNVEDIEFEVNQWRAEKREKVEIKLFPGEEEYLSNNMKCTVFPVLYEIKDEHLKNRKDCPKFIKTTYSKKTKKLFRLKKKEKKILDSLGIDYKPLVYIVYL